MTENKKKLKYAKHTTQENDRTIQKEVARTVAAKRSAPLCSEHPLKAASWVQMDVHD